MKKYLRFSILLASSLGLLLACNTTKGGGNNPGPNPDPDPDPEETETYEGYIALEFYTLKIAKADNSSYYLNPRNIDFEIDPDANMPFSFASSNENIATVSRGGGIKSSKIELGDCVITCTAEGRVATCKVTVVETLPAQEPVWKKVTNFASLTAGDILVFGAPKYGKVAGLNNTGMKLNATTAAYSNDFSTITSMDSAAAQFVLDGEEEHWTLEAQNNKYLAGTNEKKVTFLNNTHGSVYWDIYANNESDYYTENGNGTVIENLVENFGNFMFNVQEDYFTTYYDNNIREGFMELPVLYKLTYQG